MKQNKLTKITILFAILILNYSCSDDGGTGIVIPDTIIPTITTNNASDISSSSVKSGGTISYTGNGVINRSGVCYSTSQAPTLDDLVLENTPFLNDFNLIITNLVDNSAYYLRAFAEIDNVIYYGNEVNFSTLLLQTYNIGDIGPGGGYVFYLDNTNSHGLEVAPSSTQFQTQWGCYSTSITGTESDFGTGAANSNIILEYHDNIDFYSNPTQCQEYVAPVGVIQSTGDVAAKKCNDLVYNGFSDWFLPSKAELELAYTNLKVQGLGDFGNDWLASSTQSASDYKKIDIVLFNDGDSWGYWKHDLVDYRAIRSF